MTITADNNDAENRYGKPPSRLAAYSFYVGAVMVAIASAAVLIAKCANAQTAEPTAPAASTQAASSAAAPAAPQVLAKASPRYSARDIERAFNFMDANQDGKISREEASGFRNVAKHFDAADSNKDNTLSLEEFGNALNRP